MDIFSLERFKMAIPQILSCLGISIKFFIVCVIGVTILSIIVAVLRKQQIVILKQFMAIYVSYMRGTPILVQMLVVYYGLPALVFGITGININGWDAIVFAMIAVILNESAFFGEVARGAIDSIPVVQREAGYSIGMTRTQTFLKITLPQAVKIMIPTYGQTVIGIFQDTSILYLIGITDMMARAKAINASTHHSLEAYAVVAIVYIGFSLILKFTFSRAEKVMEAGR